MSFNDHHTFVKRVKAPVMVSLFFMLTPGFAALEGKVNTANCDHVSGWAWESVSPLSRVAVSIYDGKRRLATLAAKEFRKDLLERGMGDGKYGFYFLLPASIRNLKSHTLSVRYSGTTTDLPGSPKTTSACYGKLNDTGWQTCSDLSGNGLTCPAPNYAGQDGEEGRDALARSHDLRKTGKGDAGFDFTKVANDGSKRAATVALGSGGKDWACTLDNVTGLLWEIKIAGTGLRDQNNSFSWYNPDTATNGGLAGFTNFGTCTGGILCNIEAYKNAVNSIKLCGRSNWRVPNANELLSIVNHGVASPSLDTTYFPNTFGWHWSYSPYAQLNEYAWFVDFGGGISSYSQKQNAYRVMLVSGGK